MRTRVALVVLAGQLALLRADDLEELGEIWRVESAQLAGRRRVIPPPAPSACRGSARTDLAAPIGIDLGDHVEQLLVGRFLPHGCARADVAVKKVGLTATARRAARSSAGIWAREGW